MSSTKYADEGTVAHALAAMCLTEGKDAAAYIGRRIECADYPHAKLSPSGAHRWMRCPGSHALETRIAFVPRKFTGEVTREMAEGVQVYLDNIRAFKGEDGVLLVEQSLPIGQITGEEGATGTGDGVILRGNELQIHDLKFGKGVEVSAYENEQLQLYGLGALHKLGDLADDVERVRFVIHQPRINTTPSEWDCSVGELRAFGLRATEMAKTALTAAKFEANWVNKDDKLHYLTPGEKQCRFCEAKATCPKLAAYVQEGVGAQFEVLAEAETNEVAAEQIGCEIGPEGAPTDELSLKMQACSLIEDWVKAVRAEVAKRLHAGQKVPGFKLVKGKRGARQWADATQAEEVLKKMRLKKEEMYTFSLISPTAAEKLVPAIDKKTGKPKDGEDNKPLSLKQWDKLQELITQSEGAASVAPESDPRPAIEVTPPADAFEVVPSVEDLV